MFRNIDGHHLISKIRWNAHLQHPPQRSIKIAFGEKSIRIDPVCRQCESSKINLLLENSLDSLQLLPDSTFPDHDPVTQSKPFQYFLFRNGLMARGDTKTGIGLKLLSFCTCGMSLHHFPHLQSRGNKLLQPLSLPPLQKKVSPINLADAEAF